MSNYQSPPWLSKVPAINDEYLKKNYPQDLKLLQVIVYHRHGTRTPVAKMFDKFTPKSWDFCENANLYHYQFRERMKKSIGTYHPGETVPLDPPTSSDTLPQEFFKSERQVRIFPTSSAREKKGGGGGDVSFKSTEQNDPYYKMATNKTCGWGQLTDIGWTEMRNVGSYLRDLYVNNLHFLPESREELGNSTLYSRTTDYSRTFESLHQVISGLYPVKPSASSENVTPISIFLRPSSQENLFLNVNCKMLFKLMYEMRDVTESNFKKEFEEVKNELFSLASIGKESSEWVNTSSLVSPMHRVFDTLSSMESHQMKLPDGVSSEFIKKLGNYSAAEWIYGSNYSSLLGKIQLSPIVHELTNVLANRVAIQNKQDSLVDVLPYTIPPKMLIFSGHDTTVGPLAFILQKGEFSKEENPLESKLGWPDFGSIVTVELFEDTRKKGKSLSSSNATKETENNKLISTWPKNLNKDLKTENFYVRAMFNGNPIVVDACKAEGNHMEGVGPTMCTLNAFFSQMGPYIISEDEYIRSCIVPKKE
ncbi:hypothetical protein BB560_005670 [Smittium megazygosporum]|uniref:Acid phosphatase n=1 Tax=Smittium megazygosporum TaxID=133381 RepID=A0A2T9Z1M1_9FUNG|nr:hypothetical protein BB560_005670 [Smittium megazygosporum]